MQFNDIDRKCRECGSEEVIVDVPTVGRSILSLALKPSGAKSGYLFGKSEMVHASRTKVCTACGHVALFLRPSDVELIRGRHDILVGDFD